MKNDNYVDQQERRDKMFKKRNFFVVIFLIILITISTLFVKDNIKKFDQTTNLEGSQASEGLKKSQTSLTTESKKSSQSSITKENVTIKSKKILSIGDSITYFDNKKVPVGKITGYQQVFRNAGAIVDSYGVPGATYKEYSETMSKKKHGSLYQDIVLTKKVSIKDHDYITLFAGTNDVSSNLVIGDANSLDNPKTTTGAFNLILKYLKEQTNAEIIVFSPIYTSNHNARPEEDMEKVVSELRKVSVLNQVEYVDIYHNFEINDASSEKYLYDQLHPNNRGMKLIGEKMLEEILNNQRVVSSDE